MELVQNAEDAGAKRMAFVFEPERILVYNDGEPFRARDVWAICSAGHTAKRNKIREWLEAARRASLRSGAPA